MSGIESTHCRREVRRSSQGQLEQLVREGLIRRMRKLARKVKPLKRILSCILSCSIKLSISFVFTNFPFLLPGFLTAFYHSLSVIVISVAQQNQVRQVVRDCISKSHLDKVLHYHFQYNKIRRKTNELKSAFREAK